MDYYERKRLRTEWYKKYIFGNKLKVCTSCNGTGWWDGTFNGKQPKCTNCQGSGKTRVTEIKPLWYFIIENKTKI